jgi:hypothetical protein
MVKKFKDILAACIHGMTQWWPDYYAFRLRFWIVLCIREINISAVLRYY